MAVPGNAYIIRSGAVAHTAAQTKTVCNMIAGAANQGSIVEIGASGDAASGTLLIELCQSTQAGAGTNTAFTPVQVRGWPAQTAQNTAGVDYTAEPTVLTVVRQWIVPMPGGPWVMQFPLGREPTGIVTAGVAGKGYCLRLTPSAASNTKAYIEFEE